MPELSSKDQALIQSHLNDSHALLRRQARLSWQYAGAATLLTGAAFWLQSLWPALAVWALFMLWLFMRYQALKQRSAALSRIFTGLNIPLDKPAPPR